MADSSIERRIVIGLITSTDFIKQIREIYSVRFIESVMAKRLSTWCMEYFDKYNKAPGKNIEGIYFEKLKNGLPKDIAEEIEEDILPDLSEEFIKNPADVTYLTDQTISYFSERHLDLHSDEVKALLSQGKIIEAERLASSYKPLAKNISKPVDFSSPEALDNVELAFAENQEPLIKYPKQLGKFWNHQLVRGGFVALMASEKRGKSYWLMDMVTRSVRQGIRVAFFQAGDMTEGQQIRRFCMHLAKKSDQPKYCGIHYQPIRDCVHNQRNTCDKKERECSFGVFQDLSEDQVRRELTIEQLREAYDNNPDYIPCWNCKDYLTYPWGSVWLEKVDTGPALGVTEAKRVFEDYFIKNHRQLMLSTHPNNTLSVKQIEALLDTWEKQYDFIADLIVIDYADLLVPDTKLEFRHQQNEIWKNLRSLSQDRHALVVTVTQADASSYDSTTLKLKNFSEDKRKYAHVTAMYGLNQDPKSREKKIGIMRINELVVREGYFDSTNVCYVLQNLSRGQPYLSSYF